MGNALSIGAGAARDRNLPSRRRGPSLLSASPLLEGPVRWGTVPDVASTQGCCPPPPPHPFSPIAPGALLHCSNTFAQRFSKGNWSNALLNLSSQPPRGNKYAPAVPASVRSVGLTWEAAEQRPERHREAKGQGWIYKPGLQQKPCNRRPSSPV